jgi:hypothetical protein
LKWRKKKRGKGSIWGIKGVAGLVYMFERMYGLCGWYGLWGSGYLVEIRKISDFSKEGDVSQLIDSFCVFKVLRARLV